MEEMLYPRSWYPVARSRDLKPGASQRLRAFGAEWVLFRTESGTVGMTARHCPHMGADLGQGRVKDDTLLCPLHGWRFDRRGDCVCIPASSSVPRGIRIKSIPCRERYSLIFAFWGEEPDFDIPSPPQMSGELVCSRPYVLELPTAYHVPSLNSFDLQHFERIHNRQFVEPPKITGTGNYHLQIDYTAKIIKKRWIDRLMAVMSPGQTEVIIDCWGASILLMENRVTGVGAVFGMLPIEHDRSRLFIVAIKERDHSVKRLGATMDKLVVSLGVWLVEAFLHPDLRVISNMAPFRGELIDGLDDGASTYWDYWEKLPRWDGS